jgi:hypothetical protein
MNHRHHVTGRLIVQIRPENSNAEQTVLTIAINLAFAEDPFLAAISYVEKGLANSARQWWRLVSLQCVRGSAT